MFEYLENFMTKKEENYFIITHSSCNFCGYYQETSRVPCKKGNQYTMTGPNIDCSDCQRCKLYITNQDQLKYIEDVIKNISTGFEEKIDKLRKELESFIHRTEFPYYY